MPGRASKVFFLIGAAFAAVGGLIAWFLIPDQERISRARTFVSAPISRRMGSMAPSETRLRRRSRPRVTRSKKDKLKENLDKQTPDLLAEAPVRETLISSGRIAHELERQKKKQEVTRIPRMRSVSVLQSSPLQNECMHNQDRDPVLA